MLKINIPMTREAMLYLHTRFMYIHTSYLWTPNIIYIYIYTHIRNQDTTYVVTKVAQEGLRQ